MVRWYLALCLLISGLTALGQNGRVDRAVGFRGCANCHGIPDSGLASDELWIKRIATTACVTPAPPSSNGMRKELMDYLRSKNLRRPQLESQSRTPTRNEGQLSVSFDQGILLLMPVDKSGPNPVRLVWGKTDKDAKRTLAAGKYQVQNYKIRRQGKNGKKWELWASGSGKTLAIEAGATTRLKLEDGVELKTTLRTRRNRMRAAVAVTADSGMGATLIRDGKRVPAQCRLVGSKGNRITDMGYA